MTKGVSYFTEEQKAALDPARIPRHVAIIPDGNRRWALQEGVQRDEGHHSGASGLMEIMRAAKELGIKTVTVYTFSTENWNRDADEVRALMWLIQTFLWRECQEMVEQGVKLATIGDLAPLSADLKQTIAQTKVTTAQCDKIVLILAINYGSRDEMRRVITRIVDDYSTGKVKKEKITESVIASYLDTAPFGDPDLYIRTSGEIRVSNYLLWQIAYSELYFTDVLWPDFKPHHLWEAVRCFQTRKRRLGA